MNNILDRDTLGMMRFADASYELSDNMEAVCMDLISKADEAREYMQEQNGQEAIDIINELVEGTLEAVFVMRILADEIMMSAELLEDADGLLDGGTGTRKHRSYQEGNSFSAENNLRKARHQAVRDAWEKEVELVKSGKGTRDWTVAQQAELLKYGRVTGFEGNHMKSVKDFPEYAGDYNNIQFLTYEEHYYGAHGGNWKNDSNGRMDYSSGALVPFRDNEAPSRIEINLSAKYDPSQYELTKQLGRAFGYGRHEDIKDSRGRIRGK